MPRYATGRQKVCISCSTAKTRCDRKPGQCSRCTSRGLSCVYPLGTQTADSTADNSRAVLSNDVPADHGRSAFISSFVADKSLSASGTRPLISVCAQLTAANNMPGAGLVSPRHSMRKAPDSPVYANFEVSESTAFTPLVCNSTADLFCPIDADAIKNRWLNSYLSEPKQKLKHYSATITAFVYRILNSYVSVTVRGHGTPPFVHTSQVVAIHTMPALSTCLTVVRMCDKPLTGSEHVISDTIQREMRTLHEQHTKYDDMSLFAAFQAHLIYCMVLFFRLNEVSSSFQRQAMMELQSLACATSRRGLVCVAEHRSARPRWEAWIVAESKRRTLFTMYLFDSLLSAEDGVPTALGTELEGLPGPANRQLWTASTRQEWETAYDVDRAEWAEGFCIDELWPVPTNLNDSEILSRRSRVDRWLEKVDEFGTMLYAVTCCTHGA